MPPPTNTHIGFLIIDEHSGKGGLENVLINVVNGLQKTGISSTIFMQLPPQDLNFIKNFKDVRLMETLTTPAQHKFLPKFLRHQLWKKNFSRQCFSFISPQKIDALVILNISYGLLRTLPALYRYKKNFPNIPIISWPHGSLKIIDKQVLYKLQKKNTVFDHFFAISSGIQKELQVLFNTDKVTLLHNPIANANSIIKRNPKKLLYIGRVNSKGKRVKELLEILAKIQGEWHLDIIGGASSKQEEQDFLQIIIDLQLQQKVTIHGWNDDPWSLVYEAGALLLHSTSEGFPSVLIEAMKRGIPCISSNCPTGPNEIIRNDENGWLYEVNDSDQCHHIIQGVIDGSRILPPPKQVIESVSYFSEERMLLNFKDALLNEIQKHEV